jgi:hypothetical protein
LISKPIRHGKIIGLLRSPKVLAGVERSYTGEGRYSILKSKETQKMLPDLILLDVTMLYGSRRSVSSANTATRAPSRS